MNQQASAAPAAAPQIAPADPAERLPLAFLDCETTGLDASAGARIISLAILPPPATAGAAPPKPHLFHFLPPEDVTFNDDSRRIHGLSRARLARLNASPFAETWPSIRDLVQDTIPEECLWLAHNAPFDAGFLAAELQRAGERGHPLADPARWRCVLAWSRRHWPAAGRHSLDAIARRLGLPAQNLRKAGSAHQADSDTALLALCWREALADSRPAPPDLFAAHDFDPDANAKDMPEPLALPPLTDRERQAHEAFAAAHGLRAVPEPATRPQ